MHRGRRLHAAREGFEPPEGFPSGAFKAPAIGRSATSPEGPTLVGTGYGCADGSYAAAGSPGTSTSTSSTPFPCCCKLLVTAEEVSGALDCFPPILEVNQAFMSSRDRNWSEDLQVLIA